MYIRRHSVWGLLLGSLTFRNAHVPKLIWVFITSLTLGGHAGTFIQDTLEATERHSVLSVTDNTTHEINNPNPLKIHWNNDQTTGMRAKTYLEPFQHHQMNIWYGFRILFSNTYIDWYDFRNLYLQKACCLV